MVGSNQFDWVAFYKELAHKLLQYKDDRKSLIEKVLRIYEDTDFNLPTLEKDNAIVDIDPFTFFGLFNKGFTAANRLTIMKSIAKLFDIKSPVPTSFDSIPVLNNQNATFYYFLPDRGEHDIDDLWELFGAALSYADSKTETNKERLAEYYDKCVNTKGNGTSKITMGLYWIAPETFVNLDSRNRWYIYESGKLPEAFVKTLPELQTRLPSTKYFAIVDKLKEFLSSNDSQLNDFKELSYAAWDYSEQHNKMQAALAQGEEPKDAQVLSLADEGVKSVRYWMYAPGHRSSKWEEFYSKGIMAIGWDEIGDLSSYESKSEMKEAMKELIDPSKSFTNDAHATWQFANEMKPGDIVFAKKGMHKVVGRGIVESDYIFDPERDEYKNVRKVRWTHKGEWPHPGGTAVLKTLTDISAYTNYKRNLDALFEDEMEDDVEEVEQTNLPPYGADDFLNDVYMDKARYNTLVSLVLKKKNVILQGAPGVGKTYAAKRLAYSIMGVKDPSRVMMVQFHQSYSYEDFIMGYRPTSTGGFEPKNGVFYDFCKSAAVDDEKTPYFFIIDEINRGNLSKIFGELFMLIETDKRGYEMRLLYSDEVFSVPKNVHIIGMMNTADRSLAMLDYALRRRFAFFEMAPGFDEKGFIKYRDSLASDKFNNLISCVKQLNEVIKGDDSLGEGFCIGHSYFCDLKDTSESTLSEIVEYELVPLLKEYWFDEHSKANEWIDKLRGAIK